MSVNADKIRKALAKKGYAVREMYWENVHGAPIMSGPDGGWYIDVVLSSDPEEYINTILAYSTVEALEEIESLPDLAKDGASDA